jgi:hypothetical protein
MSETDSHPFYDVADATLIEAAPELLEALQETIRCMEAMQQRDVMPDDTCPADLYDMAKSAIAKATGGEQ